MTARKDVDVPFTGADLRALADKVDEIIGELGTGELEPGDWRYGVSVEVYDDMGWVLGTIKAHEDGWLGFYPDGWVAE